MLLLLLEMAGIVPVGTVKGLLLIHLLMMLLLLLLLVQKLLLLPLIILAIVAEATFVMVRGLQWQGIRSIADMIRGQRWHWRWRNDRG